MSSKRRSMSPTNIAQGHHPSTTNGPRSLLSILPKIPEKSLVELIAYDNIHEGIFHLNMKGPELSRYDHVTLTQATNLSTGEQLEDLMFNLREIQDVKVLKQVNHIVQNNVQEGGKRDASDNQKPGPAPAFEYTLKTFIVRNKMQFQNFLNAAAAETVIAMSFEGQEVNRFGRVTWILMAIRFTFVAIDLEALMVEVPNPWEMLNRKIFKYGRICKVVHGCEGMFDYLFHYHGIIPCNVFDTRVAAMIRSSADTGVQNIYPLSHCLRKYLESKIPMEEIKLLQTYESMDFKKNSPWLEQPLPPNDICKYGVLKVKHLEHLKDFLARGMFRIHETAINKIISKVRGDDE